MPMQSALRCSPGIICGSPPGCRASGFEPMLLVELTCLVIVALYLTIRLSGIAAARPVVERLVLLAIASFIGEDSVIRAYHFYDYSRGWHLFVDRVPLLIVLIWPIVIDSAWVLAHRVTGGRKRSVALVAAAFVLADASLIEPISVRAGLWSWSEPGWFAVPPIGILGWAFFAWAAITLFERVRLIAVVLAPLVTHGLLLLAWWGALRWVNGPVAAWTAASTAWALLLPAAALIWILDLRARVPPRELWARLPGALFFFVLLFARPLHGWALLTYASAFVPPYLALWRPMK
jgi:hypothetical protein